MVNYRWMLLSFLLFFMLGGNAFAAAAASGSGGGRSWIWFIAAAAAAAAIGVAVLFGWRKRQKLEQQRARIDELIEAIDKAKAELKPYDGQARGMTEELIERINGELSGSLLTLNELKSQSARSRIFLLHYTRLNAEADTLRTELDSLAAGAERNTAEIRRIADTGREAERTIRQLAAQSAALRTEIELQSKATSFPLEALFDRLKHLESEVSRAFASLPEDPVAAETIARNCLGMLDLLTGDMDDFPLFFDQFDRFESAIADCRSRLDEIRETAGIGRAIQRLNPYFNFGLAREALHKMYRELRRGDMSEVRSFGMKADRLLAEAVEVAAAQAGLKDATRFDAERLLNKTAVLCEEIADLEQPFEQIRSAYAVIHWSALLEKFRRAKEDAADAEARLVEASGLASDAQQQFDRARALLDQLPPLLSAAEQTVQECGETFRKLAERLEACRNEIGSLQESYRQTLQAVSSEALVLTGESERLRATAEALGRKTRELAQTEPFNLDSLEFELEHYRQDIEALREHVGRAAADKQEALLLMQAGKTGYESLQAAGRGRINERHYRQRYESLSCKAGKLLAAGLYAEALKHASDMKDLIERMNHDYENALAEERRQELLEQRHLRRHSSDYTLHGGGHSAGSVRWNSAGIGVSDPDPDSDRDPVTDLLPDPNPDPNSDPDSGDSSGRGGG
ncbi:hypothetical protein [Paenibacillus beijingensis]|uniref:Septation ring formation regulator EzrA n=1 Tax=Paenibacillus beijingensis TaxID=1126833 RepID=A0A0D5NL67_9BACL|nr:hypothetical protein [Paenibacillus beijingensis]AJY75648.1 hypothetical protein VN24_15125 [Paenibacillus beijingensis]